MFPHVGCDGFVMSVNVSSAVSQSSQSIVQVGGVRAFRLQRDLGLETVYDVARSSPAELMQITSVGPVRAKEIFTDANKIVDEWKAANPISKEHRVAVVTGKEAFDDLKDGFLDREGVSKRKLLEDALEEAGVLDEEGEPAHDSVRIGHVAGDAMGGKPIGLWLSMVQTLGSELMSRKFETPWSKYSRVLDPLRHVDDEYLDKHDIDSIDDVPAGRSPEPPKLGDIPYDIDRISDVSWYMAMGERRLNMVKWADEVVIALDGEYADYMRRSCNHHGVECTTVFDVSSGYPLKWSPSEDDVDHFEPDEDETVRGGNGVREGSVPDLASDEFFRDKPNDTSDGRVENDPNDLTKADCGGTGVGSMSNRWS